MSRHLADHRGTSQGGRLRAFYQIEKTGGEEAAVHPASRDLHRRAFSRGEGGRTANYVRIERGRTA